MPDTTTPASVAASKPKRWKRPVATSFAILAALLWIASGLALWVNRTILNTDLWIDRVIEPVSTDPEVIAAVSDRTATEIVNGLDLENRIAGALPDELGFLSGSITGGIRDFMAERADDLLSSEEFQQLFLVVNREAHDAAVKVLRGDTERVGTEGGRVTLNLLPFINGVLTRIEGFLSGVFNREIDLPEATGERTQLIAALEDRLGVDLPDDFGEIVVFESDKLAAAQDAVALLDTLKVVLPLIALVVTVLAFVVSPRRRHTLLVLLISMALLAFVVVIGLGYAVAQVKNEVTGPGGLAALDAAVAGTTAPLKTFTSIVITVAVVASALVWLFSNTPRASRMRARLGPSIARNTAAWQIGGAVALLIVMAIWPGRSGLQFLVGVLAIVAYEVAVTVAARAERVKLGIGPDDEGGPPEALATSTT